MKHLKTVTDTPLIIVLVVVAAVVLRFGIGAMIGMMGSGWLSGISGMWIPILLILGLGVLLSWVLFRKRNALAPNKPPTAQAEVLMTWADDGGKGE